MFVFIDNFPAIVLQIVPLNTMGDSPIHGRRFTDCFPLACLEFQRVPHPVRCACQNVPFWQNQLHVRHRLPADVRSGLHVGPPVQRQRDPVRDHWMDSPRELILGS